MMSLNLSTAQELTRVGSIRRLKVNQHMDDNQQPHIAGSSCRHNTELCVNAFMFCGV